jgi:hypothetical protein
MAGRVTYGCTVVPGGKDGNTRSITVDRCAVVGEGSESVRAVGSTNGEDGRLRSRRDVGSVLGLVTSGNSQEDTRRDDTSSGGVHGGGLAATKRHVGNGTVGAAAGLGIAGDEVDASNDTRVGTLV